MPDHDSARDARLDATLRGRRAVNLPIDPEPEEPAACPVCGNEMQWEQCWNCQGEGGFHNCGEDCCCCLHPELDLNDRCEECDGQGGYLQCPALPHTEEQLAAHEEGAE